MLAPCITRVVDVEERRDLRLGRRGQGVLDLGRGRGRLAGHRGPALEVQPTGGGHCASLPRLRGSPAGHEPLWNHGRMSLDSAPATSAGRLEPTLVADLVALSAARDGGRDALVETSGRRLTWADLDSEVDRVATGLGDAGVVAGQRVLLAMGNRVELVDDVPGRPARPARGRPGEPAGQGRGARVDDRRLRRPAGRRRRCGRRRGTRGRRPGPRGARRPRDVLDDDVVARAASPGLVVVGSDPRRRRARVRRAARRGGPAPPAAPDPETLAVPPLHRQHVDLPRAAMLTHRALLANIEQAAAVDPAMIAPDDVVLGVLPLFHVYGLNAVLGSVLRHGATLVLVDHFDPRGTLDVVAEHGVTVVPVAPAVFPHWLALDDLATAMAGVRLVASGSAPLAPGRDGGVHLAHRGPGPPGVRAHRGRPRRDQHARLGRAGARLAGVRAARGRPAARRRPRPRAGGR